MTIWERDVSQQTATASFTPYPLMERSLSVLFLAVAAGVMSGYTFFAKQLFATVQSGNVIQFGYWLAMGDITRWAPAALSVLAFGLGSVFTGILENVTPRRLGSYSAPVLFFEAAVLGVLGFTAGQAQWDRFWFCYIISFLAGMQGNAFHMMRGMLYGNIAVTMVVQLAFNHLTQAFFRVPFQNLTSSGLYFLVLLGFSGGGFAGAALTKAFGERALWLAAVILFFAGISVVVAHRSGVPVDEPI